LIVNIEFVEIFTIKLSTFARLRLRIVFGQPLL